MIFNLQAGEVKTLPTLSDKYPEDITVKAGEKAVFSAVIDEDGIPTEYTYQWYVNDSIVSDATTAVYTRKTDEDNGAYTVYCEITNKAGTVKTRTAQLEVNALPKLDSSKIVNATIAIGEPKTYAVSISEHGYPRTYTYQWYQDGVKISGATSSSYSYSLTTLGKHTLYCEVTNSAGTVKSATATINANCLFKAGMTSGLKTTAWKGHDAQTAAAPSVSYKSDGAYITGPSEAGQNGMAYFDAIDLTNVSKITLKLIVSGMFVTTNFENCHCVGVWKTIGSGVYGSTAAVLSRLNDSSGEVTYTLNVSNLTGLFFVGFGMRAAGTRIPKVVIHEIILS